MKHQRLPGYVVVYEVSYGGRLDHTSSRKKFFYHDYFFSALQAAELLFLFQLLEIHFFLFLALFAVLLWQMDTLQSSLKMEHRINWRKTKRHNTWSKSNRRLIQVSWRICTFFRQHWNRIYFYSSVKEWIGSKTW